MLLPQSSECSRTYVVNIDSRIVTAEILSGPDHGNLSGSGDSPTYRPDPGFFGADPFSYRVSDGLATSGSYVINLTVVEVNVAPDARDDRYDVTAGTSLSVAAPGVLTNDEDGDGDPLTAEIVEGPQHGRLQLAADGSFACEPDRAFTGSDT